MTAQTYKKASVDIDKADVKDEVNFFEALKNFGYEVKAKDLQLFLIRSEGKKTQRKKSKKRSP